MLSAQKNTFQVASTGRLIARRTTALAIIAARLIEIDTRLERVSTVVERDISATTPF